MKDTCGTFRYIKLFLLQELCLKDIMKRIPLFSGLLEINPSHHKEASSQFLYTIIFALMPSLLFMFITLIASWDLSNTWKVFKETINGGDLFMISTSLLGPICYLVITEYAKKTLLNKESILFIVILLLIFSSAGYIAVKKHLFTTDLQSTNAIEASLLIFLISMLILYLSMVYQKKRELEPSDAEASLADNDIKINQIKDRWDLIVTEHPLSEDDIETLQKGWN